MAGNFKKLVILLDDESAIAIPAVVGQTSILTYAFNITRTTAGTISADRFGRFLSSEVVPATAPGNSRARQVVAAWFNPSSMYGSEAVRVPAVATALDFIAATGVATTLASIDPLLTRNFRLRMRVARTIATVSFAQATLNGSIFVQRSHSFEI